ncbi:MULTISPECIES: galactokinase [unclassified Luteococcus]|uniref:galactokinase n=1 Tax=unclassified Luteococcus TaxID=2639923 RepID=UPI00313C28B6
MALAADLVTQRFTELTGQPPAGVWFAPGRVNLIGEHTDYNDGYVMPFALDLGATLAAGVRPDDAVRVDSVDLKETVELAVLRPYDQPSATTGWAAYLAGVVWALRQAGHEVGGVDLVLASDVPIGAGLSSSAAIECAVVAACCDLFGLEISPVERAKIARAAENQFVGAPTGLLDQAASTLCQRDAALFLDCRSLETVSVPLPLGEQGLEILVLDTHTPHSHVDGEYAERRATCEAAARRLGVPALRDVTDLDAALASLDDELQRKRTRHVVTEDERVLQAVELGRAGRLRELGPLLDASHASMRDDFQITVATVDLAVQTAKEHGALGARMTGGGFGGCIIALCEAGSGEQLGERVAVAFAEAGFNAPTWFTVTPEQGARRLV